MKSWGLSSLLKVFKNKISSACPVQLFLMLAEAWAG